MKWLAILVFAFSFTSYAGEVTSFEDRPAAVEEGEDTYVGILVSEESYRKSLKKIIDHAAEKANCAVDRRVCKELQDRYKLSIKNLEEVARKRDTWFERNKGSLGFITGMITGAAAVVAVVKAVYQGQ
tara:strand:+ start:436 stop:819 length:384 start_codon:yes stop_codon:yes gene_type:complete